jgi:hypothetical protein
MSAVLRTRVLFSIWLSLALLGVACGDDDAPATDAGAKDAASSDSGPSHIPRRDAAVSTTDAIPVCDRSDPLGCGPGQVCDLVIRRAPSETQFTVYTGCVEARRERAAGDPCDPDLTSGAPYSAPGLTDEVYTDPCAAGLICAPDRAVRGGATCQPVCSSGQLLGDTPLACQSSTAVCLLGGQFVEFCRESERCDVEKQTGCRGGEGCYLRPGNDGKSLLAVCRALPAMPVANGQPCTGFYACNPGSLCLGPVHLPPSRWQQTDLRCRPACGNSGADQDAGADDAGVGDGCKAGAQCTPFSESGLNLSSIPKPPYGQCEP